MATEMHELEVPKAFEELMATKLHELKAQQDFCCALVYLQSQVPQLVHGASEIPVPLLRQHGIGVSMTSC